MKLVVWSVLALMPLGCAPAFPEPPPRPIARPVATAVDATASRNQSACDDLFRPPPGAKELCNEHVLGDTMEIAWRSWATPKPSAEVIEPYRALLASCPEATQTKPGQVALGPARLMIHAVGEPFPTCSTNPAAGDRTVVVVSYGYPR